MKTAVELADRLLNRVIEVPGATLAALNCGPEFPAVRQALLHAIAISVADDKSTPKDAQDQPPTRRQP